MNKKEKILAITKDTFGYLESGEQISEIESLKAERFPEAEIQYVTFAPKVDWMMDELLDSVGASGASHLFIWNLLALSPVIHGVEDLLLFLASLERLKTKLCFVESRKLLSAEALSASAIGALWGEFKLGRKRENARASIAKARANGVQMRRKVKSDPERMAALRRQGMSANQIADVMKLSLSSVHKTLRRANMREQ